MSKSLAIFVLVAVLAITPSFALAKGGGGGRSGGGFRSVSRPSTPSVRPSTPSKPAVTAAPKPVVPKITTRPTASTPSKTVTAAPKTASGKAMSKTGKVVGGTYQPRFRGYTAPAGSVVYYRQSSMLDWLPFYLLWTMNSSGGHAEAVVETPDGKTQTVQEEGVDTMYIVNWAISIIFILLIVGGIVWFVNSVTSTPTRKRYV